MGFLPSFAIGFIFAVNDEAIRQAFGHLATTGLVLSAMPAIIMKVLTLDSVSGKSRMGTGTRPRDGRQEPPRRVRWFSSPISKGARWE
jgi:hypothetical protein